MKVKDPSLPKDSFTQLHLVFHTEQAHLQSALQDLHTIQSQEAQLDDQLLSLEQDLEQKQSDLHSQIQIQQSEASQHQTLVMNLNSQVKLLEQEISQAENVIVSLNSQENRIHDEIMSVQQEIQKLSSIGLVDIKEWPQLQSQLKKKLSYFQDENQHELEALHKLIEELQNLEEQEQQIIAERSKMEEFQKQREEILKKYQYINEVQLKLKEQENKLCHLQIHQIQRLETTCKWVEGILGQDKHAQCNKFVINVSLLQQEKQKLHQEIQQAMNQANLDKEAFLKGKFKNENLAKLLGQLESIENNFSSLIGTIDALFEQQNKLQIELTSQSYQLALDLDDTSNQIIIQNKSSQTKISDLIDLVQDQQIKEELTEHAILFKDQVHDFIRDQVLIVLNLQYMQRASVDQHLQSQLKDQQDQAMKTCLSLIQGLLLSINDSEMKLSKLQLHIIQLQNMPLFIDFNDLELNDSLQDLLSSYTTLTDKLSQISSEKAHICTLHRMYFEHQLDNAQTMDDLAQDIIGRIQKLCNLANQLKVDSSTSDIQPEKLKYFQQKNEVAQKLSNLEHNKDLLDNLKNNRISLDQLQKLGDRQSSARKNSSSREIVPLQKKDFKGLKESLLFENKKRIAQQLQNQVKANLNQIREQNPDISNELLEQLEEIQHNYEQNQRILDTLQNKADPKIDECITTSKELLNEIQTLEGQIQDYNELQAKNQIENQQKQTLLVGIKKLIRNEMPIKIQKYQEDLGDIISRIASMTKVVDCMSTSQDYSSKLSELEKIAHKLSFHEQQAIAMHESIQQIEEETKILKIESLSLQQLQELQSKLKLQFHELSTYEMPIHQLKQDTNKLRLKLGNFDIPNCCQAKTDQLQHLQLNLSSIQEELDSLNLQNDMQEVGIRKLLGKISSDLTQVQQRLDKIRSTLSKFSDLTKEPPENLLPLIIEIRDLGVLLTQRQIDIENLSSQLLYLKEKHLLDLQEQRAHTLQRSFTDSSTRLKSLQKQMQDLQELCDEFSGYCSDEQENNLVMTLQNFDLRQLNSKINELQKQNSDIKEKIKQGNDNLEDEVNRHGRDIKTVEAMVNKYVDNFNRIEGSEKLKLRLREVEEIEKRLGQIDIMMQKIAEESEQEIQKSQSDSTKIPIANEVSEIKHALQELQIDLRNRIVKHLFDARTQVVQAQQRALQSSNFDNLKQNKKLKKYILDILDGLKKTKKAFNDLRSRFEGCKLRMRTIPHYKPLNGDEVDKMIADWIHANSCPIPIVRLGNGYYKFGSKKIFAKITNGKLVIRVGGGYMGIDEFMYYYGAQELNKMLAYEGFDVEEDIDLDKIILQEEKKSNIITKFNDGKTVIGSQQLKRRFSPHSSSMMREGSNSRSPRPQFQIGKQSPSRIKTPGVTTNKMRRSSGGLAGSPKSSLSHHQKSTGFTETHHSHKSMTPLIQQMASNVQGKKGPITDPFLSQAANLNFQSLPQQNQYQEFLKNDLIGGIKQQHHQSVSLYEDPLLPIQATIEQESGIAGEPKSKIMELIKERKAAQAQKSSTSLKK